MKLYYAPPMASLAVFILACEIDVPMTLVQLNSDTGQLEDGRLLRELNAKNCLPVLERDDGSILTETPIILDWLARQDPKLRFTAMAQSEAHIRIWEWMIYFATEQHKLYTLLFWPIDDAAKRAVKIRIEERFTIVEQTLSISDFLVGDHLTIADLYLFVMVRGALHLIDNFDLEMNFPNLAKHRQRLCARPAFVRAVERHGGGF